MTSARILPGALTGLAALMLTGAPAAAGRSASSTRTAARVPARSSQLWATIDVCNPTDQPDTLGIRGSMPANGQAGETMYMRFRLQYYDKASKRWIDLASGTGPYKYIGAAKSARQGGESFQLVPEPGKTFTLRGVVNFQWRRGSTVVESLSRPTTAGRRSLAGSDPAGFSAATCSIS